jgi:hypothetical protein
MTVPSTEGRFGRGVVRSGAGRGTCGRGSQPRPRAAAGQPPRGTTGSARVRPPYNAKAERCRGGAPIGAGARVMSARARRSGPARTQIGPPWSNPGHAPLRRAIPLIRGEAKRREYGQTPAPEQVRGQHSVGYEPLRGRPGRGQRPRAGTHNHSIVDSARSMGPRFRGDDKFKER